MLRVVLDTNVVVSALLKPSGPPGQILERSLEGAFVLVLSPALVEELKRSLGYPRVRRYLRLPAGEIEALPARLEMIADLVPGVLAISTSLRDRGTCRFSPPQSKAAPIAWSRATRTCSSSASTRVSPS